MFANTGRVIVLIDVGKKGMGGNIGIGGWLDKVAVEGGCEGNDGQGVSGQRTGAGEAQDARSVGWRRPWGAKVSGGE